MFGRLAWVLALLSLFAWTSPCAAEDAVQDAAPPFKLVQVGAEVFERLNASEAAVQFGVAETFQLEGKILVAVRATIQPQWADETTSIRLDAPNIALIGETGETAPMVGHFERYGQFKIMTRAFSAFRPSNWQSVSLPVYFNAVFAAPAAWKSAEFKMGSVSAKVELPTASAAIPNPASTVKVEIESTKVLDQVQSAERAGNLTPNPVTKIVNPHGVILEIKIKLTPLSGNGDDPDHFFWHTSWFAVQTRTGHHAPTFGEIFMDRLSQGVSHNVRRNTDGTWTAGQATLYFAAPSKGGKFKLMFLDHQAAEGSY